MNKTQFIYGALITMSINCILLLTALNEEVIINGFILAVLVLFAFTSMTKLIIGNANKENKAVNWLSIGCFVLGSFAATIIIIGLALAKVYIN